MTEAHADLTPPTKKSVKAAAAANGEAKPAKPKKEKEKVEKTPADPNAPKKPRAPRTDYGFSPASVIALVQGAEVKYRGTRKEWYDRLAASDGKTVEEFLKANAGITNGKGHAEPPRGWLRFFVQDSAVTLTKVDAPVEQTAAAA